MLANVNVAYRSVPGKHSWVLNKHIVMILAHMGAYSTREWALAQDTTVHATISLDKVHAAMYRCI